MKCSMEAQRNGKKIKCSQSVRKEYRFPIKIDRIIRFKEDRSGNVFTSDGKS